MGLAEEWLSQVERESIAEGLLTVTRREAGKLWAHCPFHIESTPGGAFFYNPAEDDSHCFSCGESGDLIAIYNVNAGRERADGEGVREFREKFAGQAGQQLTSSRAKGRKVEKPSWESRQCDMPSSLWSDRAENFLERCRHELEQNKQVQLQLEKWGLPMEAVRACRIGWNSKPDNESFWGRVTEWGLPFEEGKRGEKVVWIPCGLVIPTVIDKRVVRLKVRRPDPGPDEARYLPLPRGFYRGYTIYGREEAAVVAVIETERDAAMLWWHARPWGVTVLSPGSVSARPDQRSEKILRNASVIINALDSDGPGAKETWSWWSKEFPQQVRAGVPVKYGKDIGEAVQHSEFNLIEWLLAAIPKHVIRELNRKKRLPQKKVEPIKQKEAFESVEKEEKPKTGIDRLKELLANCRSLKLRNGSAAIAHIGENTMGAEGCDRCSRWDSKFNIGCRISIDIGMLMFNDKEVYDFVFNQPGKRFE